MGKRPTIQMVADRAGVSRGTVDRVLNNRSYVKAEVRTRILAAMQELGYVSPRDAHQRVLSESRFSPIRLGVILPNWPDDHFRSEVQRGIQTARAELTDFHVDVMLCHCQTDIPGEVIELLDQLVADGAQGIAMCAIANIAIEAKIDQLAAQGIPTITFNSDLPNSKRLCFIGQDYRRSGRIAAELMSKCIDPKGKILAAVGNLEFDGHRTRLDGFCERMHELGFDNGQIEIVETFNDYHTTYRKVLESLSRCPDLSAIYMANQSVAGCTEAIHAATPKARIRVICHDISESTKRLLRSGDVDLAISQDIYQQGYLPLILLRDLLQKGKSPAAQQPGSNISIFCAENL